MFVIQWLRRSAFRLMLSVYIVDHSELVSASSVYENS